MYMYKRPARSGGKSTHESHTFVPYVQMLAESLTSSESLLQSGSSCIAWCSACIIIDSSSSSSCDVFVHPKCLWGLVLYRQVYRVQGLISILLGHKTFLYACRQVLAYIEDIDTSARTLSVEQDKTKNIQALKNYENCKYNHTWVIAETWCMPKNTNRHLHIHASETN